MGTLKPNWKKIAKNYITGDISMSKLAKKSGVPVTTLKDHARREKWSERRAEYRRETGAHAVKASARETAPPPEKFVPDESDIESVEKVFIAADMLIDRVIEVLEKEKYLDGKDLSALATAISKAKEIKNLRYALDIREQEARIATMEKAAAMTGSEGVQIVFSDDAEEAAI